MNISTQFTVMKSEACYVTPSMAKAWLQANTANRPVKKTIVKTYAHAMKRGEWKLSPQGISFSASGRLIDGQHRLMAILESGASVWVYVTSGAPDDAFDALDQGARRSYADISRLPKRVAEMRGYLARMLAGQSMVPTAVQINDLVPHSINEAAQRLIDAATFPRKGVGAAPSLGAAALRSMQGKSEWVIETYRAMIQLDFAALDPAPLSFLKQCLNGDDGSSNQRFARSWEAFDFAGRARKKIVLRDERLAAAEASEFIAALKSSERP